MDYTALMQQLTSNVQCHPCLSMLPWSLLPQGLLIETGAIPRGAGLLTFSYHRVCLSALLTEGYVAKET